MRLTGSLLVPLAGLQPERSVQAPSWRNHRSFVTVSLSLGHHSPACSLAKQFFSTYIVPGFLVVYGGRIMSITAILCGQTQKFLVVSFYICFSGAQTLAIFMGTLGLGYLYHVVLVVNVDPTSVQYWLEEPVNFVFLPRTTPRQMASFSRASPCQLVIFLLSFFIFCLNHLLCIPVLC